MYIGFRIMCIFKTFTKILEDKYLELLSNEIFDFEK